MKQCFSLTTNQPYKSAATSINPAEQSLMYVQYNTARTSYTTTMHASKIHVFSLFLLDKKFTYLFQCSWIVTRSCMHACGRDEDDHWSFVCIAICNQTQRPPLLVRCLFHPLPASVHAHVLCTLYSWLRDRNGRRSGRAPTTTKIGNSFRRRRKNHWEWFSGHSEWEFYDQYTGA